MKDLATGLALVLVVEGVLWSLFPEGMKRAVAMALDMDSSALRKGGLLFAGVGLVIVWIIRG